METVPQSREVSISNQDMLVKRAQNGDSATFDELYIINRERVYFICLRMVKNHDEAEDLVQDIFTRVFLKLNTFRQDSQFSTWLHRIAVNAILMKFRNKSVRNNVSLDELMETHDDEFQHCVASIDNHLRLSPERISLACALEKLPSERRMILIMHDIEGFQHKEIARILGCTVASSKSRLRSARGRLVAILGVKYDPPSVPTNFDKFLSKREKNK